MVIIMKQTLTMRAMEQKLRKADRKHARLYLFCNFIALMIISAYSTLMFSKTVQKVFPKGGDSRKQMYGIFVITLVGCVVFTIYAARLFFRHKSKQLGILMAIGASRKRLRSGLFREVVSLSSFSAALGVIAGFPFVWVVWSLFRLVLVDSSEMVLDLDFRCLFASVAFFLLVVVLACVFAWRYLKKTNIMEVIREEHINEPVKELGRWCGPAGFLLILVGAVIGYYAPLIWMTLFSSYSPSWLAMLYAPVFIGTYMVMLYTVVYGWGRHKKNPYKDIISRGMMKFQAKQTVNNMLVVTLLIAGGAFAIFYLPTVGLTSVFLYKSYPYDYFYQYPADQKVPGEETVRELAGKYGLSLKDWRECEYISLGVDGNVEVADEGKRFHIEYHPIQSEARILSEDAYFALTGQETDVSPGTYLYVTDAQESSVWTDERASNLTNMVTRECISTEFAGYLHYDLLASATGYYVLDNEDYEKMAEGLTDEWRGHIVQFNADGRDSYQFADAFYDLFVSSFDESCEHTYFYDKVKQIVAEEREETYTIGEEWQISYDDTDNMNFKHLWAYSPSFRSLLLNEHLCLMGVLYMMFLFIFIVCLVTSLVVCYTRCQTIALNNRYIFDDLKKLGASPTFLSKEVRLQCGNVFKVPAAVGTGAMYLLYALLLYANDGKITAYEAMGLLATLGIVALIGVVVYGTYRGSVKTIMTQLGIK